MTRLVVVKYSGRIVVFDGTGPEAEDWVTRFNEATAKLPHVSLTAELVTASAPTHAPESAEILKIINAIPPGQVEFPKPKRDTYSAYRQLERDIFHGIPERLDPNQRRMP